MNKLSRSALCLALMLTAGIQSCNGSTHTSSPIPPTPELPGNAGTAGSMDGRWRVTSMTLLTEPAPRGNPTQPMETGTTMLVEKGHVIDESSGEPADIPMTMPYEHELEWAINATESNLLRFGSGYVMTNHPAYDSGKVVQMGIFGTMTASRAVGLISSEVEFRGPNTSILPNYAGLWEVQLARVGSTEFEVKTLDGKDLRLSHLSGKLVVLNFWYIDCPPCVAEIPHLNALVAKHSGEDIVFIGCALDQREDLLTFLSGHPFSYQIVASCSPLWAQFQISTAPTHIIFDRSGHEVTRIEGANLAALEIALLDLQSRSK